MTPDHDASIAANALAVAAALEAIAAIARIAHNDQISHEARLHYLGIVRLNLAGQEDRLAGLDDLAPCIAEKFADIA